MNYRTIQKNRKQYHQHLLFLNYCMVLFRETDAHISATSIYNHVIPLGGRQNSPPSQKGGGGTSSNMRFHLPNVVINMPKSWMTNNIITYVQ